MGHHRTWMNSWNNPTIFFQVHGDGKDIHIVWTMLHFLVLLSAKSGHFLVSDSLFFLLVSFWVEKKMPHSFWIFIYLEIGMQFSILKNVKRSWVKETLCLAYCIIPNKNQVQSETGHILWKQSSIALELLFTFCEIFLKF